MQFSEFSCSECKSPLQIDPSLLTAIDAPSEKVASLKDEQGKSRLWLSIMTSNLIL